MDEKLMQYLQEQFDKINKRLNKLEYPLDKIENKLIEYDAHLLKTNGQIMTNSEMANIIRSHEKRIADLETDVLILKKIIGNMG